MSIDTFINVTLASGLGFCLAKIIAIVIYSLLNEDRGEHS